MNCLFEQLKHDFSYNDALNINPCVLLHMDMYEIETFVYCMWYSTWQFNIRHFRLIDYSFVFKIRNYSMKQRKSSTVKSISWRIFIVYKCLYKSTYPWLSTWTIKCYIFSQSIMLTDVHFITWHGFAINLKIAHSMIPFSMETGYILCKTCIQKKYYFHITYSYSVQLLFIVSNSWNLIN